MKLKDDYVSLSPEDPQSSSVFLTEVLKFHRINLSDPERQLILKWKEIAGENIARISACKGIKDGVLLVECANASEASLVRLSKTEILKNVKAVFPELDQNLKLRIYYIPRGKDRL